MDRQADRVIRKSALAAVFVLTGCATGTALTPPSRPMQNPPPVAQPAASVGDRYYFSNGRRERVTAVSADSIDIRRTTNYRYRLHADPLLPARRVERRTGVSITEILPADTPGALWPLEPGKRVSFEARKHKQNAPATRSSFWRCSVAGAERILVIAGEFDAYRIECQRRNRRNRIKLSQTLYYALDIGQVVLRVERYPTKPAKKLELTAFTPSLSMLAKRTAKRYRKFFQQVMEQAPSGNSESWWSRRADTRIHVTPMRTMKYADHGYCRNYRLRVEHGGVVRRGAGLACRDDAGRWRIPSKIDRKNGFEFRT